MSSSDGDDEGRVKQTRGNGHRTPRTVPRSQKAQVQAEIREKERKAVDLVIAGECYEKVAAQCGYSNKSSAWRAVHRLLAREDAEGATELRAVEGARLDRLFLAFWPAALDGDLKAGQLILRISQRRARMFGLDMPLQVEITDQDELTLQIAKLAAELGDLAGDAPVPVE